MDLHDMSLILGGTYLIHTYRVLSHRQSSLSKKLRHARAHMFLLELTRAEPFYVGMHDV